MANNAVKVMVILILVTGLSACGGNELKSCDDVQKYQLANKGKAIETPEDLDDLEPLRAMPLPEANPSPPRPEGSPCIDLPPSILSGQ